MSDIMKTFTVRELDRETSRVLKTCDAEGVVRICGRNGRAYTVRPEPVSAKMMSLSDWLKERRRRTRELFKGTPPMTKKQLREFDRLIASE